MALEVISTVRQHLCHVAELTKLFLGTPDVGQRLAMNGDPSALSQDFDHYFDPTKFTIPGIFPVNDGQGPRNYLTRPSTYANDMTLTKAFNIREGHGIEIRAAFYNAFNQVRRSGINTSLQFKANGRTFADGFTLFNTPEQLAARNSNLTGVALYNQYRTGVGHYNVTDVSLMRVIEIGLKYRF